ncbi:MAG TPA: YraN family protein [Microbacteriaceae bacterium]|nr:YraN family protein [Microbacteriaceae bacterium]
MARNIELGRRGERIAADFLTIAGHRVVDRNWRSRSGELDIVTIDRGVVVAVEVKTRTSLDFGHPFEAIDHRKLHRVYRLAWEWCAAHRMSGARLRVDAVSVIVWRDGGLPTIEHLEGVR